MNRVFSSMMASEISLTCVQTDYESIINKYFSIKELVYKKYLLEDLYWRQWIFLLSPQDGNFTGLKNILVKQTINNNQFNNTQLPMAILVRVAVTCETVNLKIKHCAVEKHILI